MGQVISTQLPNGRVLHVPYDAIARAALEYYHTGRVIGEVPKGRRGEPGRVDAAAYERARTRSNDARVKLEEEIEAALGEAITNAWDAAMASLRPFRCGHCGERFETAASLIGHATEHKGPDEVRPECRAELEMSLRLASDWARPKPATATAMSNGS